LVVSPQLDGAAAPCTWWDAFVLAAAYRFATRSMKTRTRRLDWRPRGYAKAINTRDRAGVSCLEEVWHGLPQIGGRLKRSSDPNGGAPSQQL
jgi:hypothetical protein